MILPYKIEVSKLLIFFMCLLDKENPLLDEFINDSFTKSSLKTNAPQNKTINALIEWKVNNNPEKALELLEEGRKILDKCPNLRAQIMEEKYIYTRNTFSHTSILLHQGMHPLIQISWMTMEIITNVVLETSINLKIHYVLGLAYRFTKPLTFFSEWLEKTKTG